MTSTEVAEALYAQVVEDVDSAAIADAFVATLCTLPERQMLEAVRALTGLTRSDVCKRKLQDVNGLLNTNSAFQEAWGRLRAFKEWPQPPYWSERASNVIHLRGSVFDYPDRYLWFCGENRAHDARVCEDALTCMACVANHTSYMRAFGRNF